MMLPDLGSRSGLWCVLCVLACITRNSMVTSFIYATSGLITVFPQKEYVEKGDNFTAYCSLNRSMTTRSSKDLVWHRGYPTNIPPWDTSSLESPPLPENVQEVVNETTKSITFLNMTLAAYDYYHCYLSDETEYANTANCHIIVLERPPPLEHLTCGGVNLHSFYCSWEDVDTQNVVDYVATYASLNFPEGTNETMTEEDCKKLRTPGVPEGYKRRCVSFTNERTLFVNVRVSNRLGWKDTSTTFRFNQDVKPLPLENLRVQDIMARSFRVTGGPPPEWIPPPEHPSAAIYLLSYEVQYTPDGEAAPWETVVIDGHELDETIGDLDPNTLYKIRARSKYQQNWSDWSDVDKEKTKEAAPSGNIKQLHVNPHPSQVDRDSRSLMVQWQDLTLAEKGSDSMVYYVEIIDQRNSEVVRGDSTRESEKFFPDISKFKAFTIRVTPGNSIGNGTASNTSIRDLSGTPGAPVNFQWKSFNETDGTLSWEDPTEPNAIITKFIVEWRLLSEPTFETEEVTWDAGERYYTLPLTGLVAREHYEFKVCAVSLKDDECGVVARIEGRTGGRLNIPIAYIVVPLAFLVVFICLVCLLRYHTRVKRSLPEPYFVDRVKNTIYGQATWTVNESQFFIMEKELFDAPRTIDDSTQLLGLDRMCSTEGSTSSSDQGIHDMDGHLTSTSSCTRLVPDAADVGKEKGALGGLHVVCEDFADKDGSDAVFPEETTGNNGPSDLVAAKGDGSKRVNTPPTSPNSCHSSEEGEDQLGAVGGEPPDYPKFADRKQLSPSRPSADSGRPISSASEDSMSYTRVAENSNTMLAGTTSPDVRRAPSSPEKSDAEPEGKDQGPARGAKTANRPESPRRESPATPEDMNRVPESHPSSTPARHPSSSDEDLSGYCKQDMPLGGVVPSVTSSGVSSMGEDYSRIADSGVGFGVGSGASIPRQEAPVISRPPVPVVDDPYVTVDNLPQGVPPPSSTPPQAEAAAAPYTSPYVTTEHAV